MLKSLEILFELRHHDVAVDHRHAAGLLGEHLERALEIGDLHRVDEDARAGAVWFSAEIDE